MKNDNLLDAVGRELGQATTTLILAEHPRDRQFIGEAMLAAAALYLLKKYLDGFVEGLGVKKLGEAHGILALKTAKDAIELLQTKKDEVCRALNNYLSSIEAYRDNAKSKTQGDKAVTDFLEERGISTGEGKHIAEKIWEEIFDAG
jgi:hypothetical protein